jgi:hypothetical protein
LEDNLYKYDQNGKKLINIIRDKNINLHGLYLYFSIIKGLIWKKILEFLELFSMGKGDVTCLHVERTHH